MSENISATFTGEYTIKYCKEKIPPGILKQMKIAAEKTGEIAAKKVLREYWLEFKKELEGYEDPTEIEVGLSESLGVKIEYLNAEIGEK